jgi:dTDP-4-amino-4,6-dideoxygalactose transaminase
MGSNYTWQVAIRHLTYSATAYHRRALLSVLKTKFGGTPSLFYKNREAITAGLLSLKLPARSGVVITGFTCFVVYQAVVEAGFTPVFCDLEKDGVNPNPDRIAALIAKNPQIKAVIVQNTFGFPTEMIKLSKICRQAGVFLIEDLAHSVGTRYANGLDAGQAGDLVCLSFSQDKILDAVTGGALIIRNPRISLDRLVKPVLLPLAERVRIRAYPLLTAIIRRNFRIGGRLLHALSKKLNLLSTPLGFPVDNRFFSFPSECLPLALTAIHANPGDVIRRQRLASYYASRLPPEYLIPRIIPLIPESACLRFPIRVPKRDALILRLHRFGIHLSDIWYDAPVAPKRLLTQTTYSGECPNAETLADTILNLPTHRGITNKEADLVIREIVQWKKLLAAP